jgi:hypothetical protein
MARSTLPSELSSRQTEQEVLEGTFGQEVERHLLHEMSMYLKTNLSDPHEEVLGAPQSPARAVIRSKRSC